MILGARDFVYVCMHMFIYILVCDEHTKADVVQMCFA